ncbi:MAG: DMT family transporter [Anaerolineales bacterium]
MPKSKLIPMLEALFAVLIWGGSFIATKIALQDASPVTVVWLRFALGIPVIGTVVLLQRQFALPRGREWGYFALLGFLGITFHQWLQSNGLQTSRASTTAWIVATSPVFIAVLGWLILKESLRPLQMAGILLAAAGVLLVVSNGDLASLSLSQFGAPGDLLILISAFNWAVFSILSRHGLKNHPATRMMFWVMLLGWLMTTLLFLPSGGLGKIASFSPRGWGSIIYLGIFTSGLTYIAWYDALQSLPAAQSGAFLYIEPPVSVIVAAIVLGEPITAAALLGGSIILLGIWFVTTNKWEKRP